jgi:CTP:molybdopterin cytidylyltransferase MocA
MRAVSSSTARTHIAAIVLAAGASRRLGQPKQSVVLAGETLLERASRTAKEAGLAPLFVVLSARSALTESQQAALASNGAQLLENPDADEGMAASIRCGVRAAQQADVVGTVILACDQIALTAEHLRALIAEPQTITASRYAHRSGIPAYFPAEAFAALLALTGDVGARALLKDVRTITDEALALDLDTPEDLARAQQMYS